MPLSGLFEVRVPAGSEEAWHGKGQGVMCREVGGVWVRKYRGRKRQEGGLARVEGRMSPGLVGPGTSQSAGLGDSQGTGSTHRRAPNSVTR